MTFVKGRFTYPRNKQMKRIACILLFLLISAAVNAHDISHETEYFDKKDEKYKPLFRTITPKDGRLQVQKRVKHSHKTDEKGNEITDGSESEHSRDLLDGSPNSMVENWQFVAYIQESSKDDNDNTSPLN